MTEAKIKPRADSQLPLGWRYSGLQDVITEAQPGFACGARSPSGVIQLRMNNVDTHGNFVWDEFIRVPIEVTDLDKYRLEPGDILFNNTNSTELVGKSALFQGHSEPVVYSNHFTRTRVNTECAFPVYIVAWLIWQHKLGTFANLCNRWIGQSAVKNDILFSLEVPLPPTLAEQKRIARILNEQMAAVEKARAAAEARLEAAKALSAAYLRPAFNSKEVHRWQKRTLGEITSSIQNGIYKSAEFYGHGHPFLRMYNIQNDSWKLSADPIARVELDQHELARFKVRPGDILVSRVNSFELVGKSAIVEPNVEGHAFENMLIQVRLQDGIAPMFVVQQMNSKMVREQITRVAKRAIGQASINSNDLRSISLRLPALAEQNRIAVNINEKDEAARHLCATLKAQLKAVDALPATLLRRAFTGGL